MTESNLILLVEPDGTDRKQTAHVLDEGGYRVKSYSSSNDLIDALQDKADHASVIILPDIEMEAGFSECLAEVQRHPNLKRVPIILRAQLTDSAIDRNLQSGMIFHHLSKSASPSRLLAITAAAQHSYSRFSQLAQEVEKNSAAFGLIRSGVFELQTLDEVSHLASILSQSYPDPKTMALGLSELMINGIEHGNLGIDYDMKTTLLEEGTWQQEIDRRLELPENKHKKIIVEYLRGENSTTITIQDEGDGFDWQKYMTIDAERLLATHGRGIAIAASSAFDEMSFIGTGNIVIATVFHSPIH